MNIFYGVIFAILGSIWFIVVIELSKEYEKLLRKEIKNDIVFD